MNLLKNSFAKIPDIDPEMLYVATESVSALFVNVDTVKTVFLIKTVGEAVGKLLIERLQEINKNIHLEIEEFIVLADKIGWAAYSENKEKNQPLSNNELATLIAQASNTYAAMRELGMPSIVQHYEVPAFNLFGLEGGFCNPYKLKYLNDD